MQFGPMTRIPRSRRARARGVSSAVASSSPVSLNPAVKKCSTLTRFVAAVLDELLDEAERDARDHVIDVPGMSLSRG